MRLISNYLFQCLATQRNCITSNYLVRNSITMFTVSQLHPRRGIASFKGNPQDFIEKINKEEAVLVYFYTPWCRPCSHFTAKVEALEADTKAMLNDDTKNILGVEVREKESKIKITTGKSSSSLNCTSTSCSISSSSPSSCSSSLNNNNNNNNNNYSVNPGEDPGIVLRSACKLCLRAPAEGGAVVTVIPVDTDENPKLGALHDIRSVPTFVTYHRGRIVGRVEGSSEEELQQLVEELIGKHRGNGDVKEKQNGSGAIWRAKGM